MIGLSRRLFSILNEENMRVLGSGEFWESKGSGTIAHNSPKSGKSWLAIIYYNFYLSDKSLTQSQFKYVTKSQNLGEFYIELGRSDGNSRGAYMTITDNSVVFRIDSTAYLEDYHRVSYIILEVDE